MTRIRATCPSCGEVDLRPADIELRVHRSPHGDVAEGSSYAFDCPGCTQVVVKPADERVARLLTTGGVPMSVLGTHQTLAEHPEQPPPGPPLTRDDLLDLHLLLRRPDWYDELLATLT